MLIRDLCLRKNRQPFDLGIKKILSTLIRTYLRRLLRIRKAPLSFYRSIQDQID